MTWFRCGRVWPIALTLGAMTLAGCENIGFSGRDAEIARVRGLNGFAVIESDAKRAVFAVRGRRVVVEPPPGYCLDRDSVNVTQSAAFALIFDCLEDQRDKMSKDGGEGEVVEISLPRTFPGILTVSISGEPAYGREARDLDSFEGLIEGEAGLKLLGRGNRQQPGRIIATRRIGGAFYVLIEEARTEVASILAPRFWRAFLDVRQRLVLVTVSSFSDRPIAEDAMLGFLARQIMRLREVNGLPPEEEETEIARQMEASLDIAVIGAAELTVIRADIPAVTLDGVGPVRAPLPPGRRMASAAPARGGTAGPSSWAPNRAPAAPARPG